MKPALPLLGLLLLAFGLACLNYTVDGKAEHHREWARANGMPEPANGIFLTGLACTAGGAGLAGFALGRRRATS